MSVKSLGTMTLALLVTAASLLAAPAPTAEAAPQVTNPCTRLSYGQTKYASLGANRVTFATSETRGANVVTITGCVRSGNGYVQEWQDWGYAGLNGFANPGLTWEDTFKSPTGTYSVTEALGRSNPGTALKYHTVNPNSRWGGEHGATYNQYFEGAGGPSDENLYTYMNQGYYEQAAVINYNRQPDMPVTQGASYAIFLHAGRTTSAGCISTSLSTVTRFLKTSQPGDRIIMGSVEDIFTPYDNNPFGPISRKYYEVGGTTSKLGDPSSHELWAAGGGGSYQNYEYGAIYVSNYGTWSVSGKIADWWKRSGANQSVAGFPAGEEFPVYGGVAQKFQNGVITYRDGIGIVLIHKEMGQKWLENPRIGAATMHRAASPNGGWSQSFAGGDAMYWSPASGAAISYGSTRAVWGSLNFEYGRLGYPTTDNYFTSTGTSQNFQGGRIDVKSNGEVTVTYGTSVPRA